jgi:hypothetical protein
MLDFADFVGDGAEEVTAVAEKARIEFAHRIGIGDLLQPVVSRPVG